MLLAALLGTPDRRQYEYVDKQLSIPHNGLAAGVLLPDLHGHVPRPDLEGQQTGARTATESVRGNGQQWCGRPDMVRQLLDR